MGFRFPAEMHFDSIILSDEAAQKQLLMQLADRDIISQETLLERFREIPNIERIRVRRETRERAKDSSAPRKAGPFHNPQHSDDVAKLAITKDLLDNEEYLETLGLPPAENEPEVQTDEVRRVEDNRSPEQEEAFSPVSENPEGGRPMHSRDSGPRKQKRVLPRSGEGVAKTLWAYEAQKTIADLVTPMALEHYQKKNARSLTKSEFDELEYLKLCILTGMKPYMEIDADVIKSIIDSSTKPSKKFTQAIENAVASFVDTQNRKPSVDEMRYIYASTFASYT